MAFCGTLWFLEKSQGLTLRKRIYLHCRRLGPTTGNISILVITDLSLPCLLFDMGSVLGRIPQPSASPYSRSVIPLHRRQIPPSAAFMTLGLYLLSPKTYHRVPYGSYAWIILFSAPALGLLRGARGNQARSVLPSVRGPSLLPFMLPFIKTSPLTFP